MTYQSRILCFRNEDKVRKFSDENKVNRLPETCICQRLVFESLNEGDDISKMVSWKVPTLVSTTTTKIYK